MDKHNLAVGIQVTYQDINLRYYVGGLPYRERMKIVKAQVFS